MTSVTIKGTVLIAVNPEETEAKIVFAPGDHNWDIASINRLIEKIGAPAADQEELESFFFKVSRLNAPAELIFAEGLAPVPPAPEQVSWGRMDFPPDIRPLVKETIMKADAPVLNRVKTERVKTEKLVSTPGRLPFLSPREKKVVTWDKRSVSEPAEVDPAVRKVGFVERGLRVGVIKPPAAGRPGKTIFGKIIQPRMLEIREFLLGYGLVRENDEIRSTVSGILRIGDIWADVIPLAKSSWEIAIGNDGVTLYLAFSPGNARLPAPAAREILTAASSDGNPDSPVLIGAERLEKAMRESIRSGEPLEDFPLYKTLDGIAELRREGEAGRALYFRKGLAGGRPLDSAAVNLALRNSGVQGVDSEALREAVRSFMGESEPELRYPLRSGTGGAGQAKPRQV
jgi:hypothetical protein